MSRALSRRQDNEHPANTVVLLREAYIALNNRVVVRLAERGHGVVRPAHGAVFQYLDGAGTSVARLAERAQMTKQAMAELVIHLEKHGYVVRQPDPHDRRAKLVVPTRKGLEVFAIAQELVPEIELEIEKCVGARRTAALRADLDRLRRVGGDSSQNS
jgi:DNA-binding MarR family transcriptional regulator